MKAEELLHIVEDDASKYDSIKREKVDYDLKRNENISNYLAGVGSLSQKINDELGQIALSENRVK